MRLGLTRLLLLAVVATGCREVGSIAIFPTDVLLTTRGQAAIVQAQPLGTRGEALDVRVTFSSSDETVATVDEAGRVIAHKTGTAVVTAHAGGQSAATNVEVRIPARVTLAPASVELTGLGVTARFQAQVLDEQDRPIPGAALSWTLEDPGVASVLDGLVTATGVGTSSVTASFGQASATAHVQVKLPEFESLTLDPGKVTLAVGARQLLVAVVKDASGALVGGVPLSFESSAPAVATVDAGGRILALAPGRANIRATAGERSASMQVVVRK